MIMILLMLLLLLDLVKLLNSLRTWYLNRLIR